MLYKVKLFCVDFAFYTFFKLLDLDSSNLDPHPEGPWIQIRIRNIVFSVVSCDGCAYNAPLLAGCRWVGVLGWPHPLGAGWPRPPCPRPAPPGPRRCTRTSSWRWSTILWAAPASPEVSQSYWALPSVQLTARICCQDKKRLIIKCWPAARKILR